MITISLISIFVITLTGFLALSRGVKRAPEGYEDESGFHFGREPQMVLLDDTSAAYDQGNEGQVEKLVRADAA